MKTMKIAGIRFKKDTEGYPDFRNITYIKRAILNKELYNLRHTVKYNCISYFLGKQYLKDAKALRRCFWLMENNMLFRQRELFLVLRKISRIENW